MVRQPCQLTIDRGHTLDLGQSLQGPAVNLAVERICCPVKEPTTRINHAAVNLHIR